jgi:hypothetical protein
MIIIIIICVEFQIIPFSSKLACWKAIKKVKLVKKKINIIVPGSQSPMILSVF